jgi:hypothetical protein
MVVALIYGCIRSSTPDQPSWKLRCGNCFFGRKHRLVVEGNDGRWAARRHRHFQCSQSTTCAQQKSRPTPQSPGQARQASPSFSRQLPASYYTTSVSREGAAVPIAKQCARRSPVDCMDRHPPCRLLGSGARPAQYITTAKAQRRLPVARASNISPQLADFVRHPLSYL